MIRTATLKRVDVTIHRARASEESATMQDEKLDGAASGYICPRCGGALWEQRADETLEFECRIGDRYAAAQLWIEHSAARNRALKQAALARRLVGWARARGDGNLAVRLEAEAAEEDRYFEQVRAMLDGPFDDEPTDAGAMNG